MTVREKASLSKSMARPGIKSVWAISKIVGELQIQGVGFNGENITVFLSPKAPTNLLLLGPMDGWRSCRSLLNAVKLNHVAVTLE